MEQKNSIFKHQRSYNNAILELLSKTTIGTNGARYKHLHTSQKINELHKPHYFTIYRHEKAIGNITICERPMLINSAIIETYYLRYFAFDFNFQIKKTNKSRKKSSSTQKYVAELLNTSNLNIDKPKYNSKIYWAIIDPENNRSLNMSERYGFKTITKIKTTAFSRSRLSKQANVTRLSLAEQNDTWQKLQQFYGGYNGLSKVHLFKNDNYFVLKENDKIIAGIQANIVEWEIIQMPGKFGKIITKIIPFVPVLNKIIKPKKHQFLASEGLFWTEGNDDMIETLLAGVLYLQNCHSMLIWTDSRNHKINSVLSNTKLGILQKLKAANEVNLVAKFNNVEESTIKGMSNNIHYISGFDCT